MEQNTQTNELEIYRDGQPDPSWKRKQVIKRVKAVAHAGADLGVWLVIDPWKSLGRELGHQMKLEIIDMFYGTSLHSQYKSGKRTQVILSAKRDYGISN